LIIDFHTHTFPEKIAARAIAKLEQAARFRAFTDGTLNGLAKSMEAGQVDYSVVVPVVTDPRQTDSINEFAAALNEKTVETGILSFGGVHPEDGRYKDSLRHIRDLGLPGIKLHPDYQSTFFDDSAYLHIVDYACELGLVIVVHAGVDIGLPEPVHCTPQMARSLMDQVRPEKLILAHMGGWKLWSDVERLLVGQNVYLDTSFSLGELDRSAFYGKPTPKEPLMGPEQFRRILAHHGADRILFATDSPWGGQKESIAYLRSLDLPEDTLEKILGGNALQLLPFLKQ
jgi:predicted TIM-barrel fold metal-dependent hydrolase